MPRAIPARRCSTSWRTIRAPSCSRPRPDVLFESALAILQLEERPRVRALPRRDRFDRFVSVLVFVPRDRYTSDLRERIGADARRDLRRPRLRLLPRFLADASDARAVHHRPQSGRGARPVAGRDRSAHPRHRPHLRGRSARGAERGAIRPSAWPRSCATMPAPSAPTTAPPSPPRMRFATSRSPSGWRRTTSRSRFFRRPAMPDTRSGDELPSPRRSDPAVAARSAPGESRLLGRQRAHLLRRARSRRRRSIATT